MCVQFGADQVKSNWRIRTLINTMYGPWSIRRMDPDQYDAWTLINTMYGPWSIRRMDPGQYDAWTLINTMHGPWSIRCMDPDQYDAWTLINTMHGPWSIRRMDPDQYDAWTLVSTTHGPWSVRCMDPDQRRRYLLPMFHTCSCRTLSLQNERIGLNGWKHRLAAAGLHFTTTTLSKHIKDSKERYLLGQNHNLQIFAVIHFIKLQKNT